MEGREGGSDGVACERRLPRICYGPIAIVSPIYEFHCDTAAHHQFGWLRRLVGSQCIRECVYNLYLFTVYSVLEREKENERKRRERGRERGRVVLCKRRPDAEYRLYSIGTYGNAALALVQADSKTVITSGKGTALTQFHASVTIIALLPSPRLFYLISYLILIYSYLILADAAAFARVPMC